MNRQEKSITDYEGFVYELGEITALLFFVANHFEKESQERLALENIHAQLTFLAEITEELFTVALEKEKELDQLKGGNQ